MELKGIKGIEQAHVLTLLKKIKKKNKEGQFVLKDCEIPIRYRALPMGFHDENERLWPSPHPPQDGFMKAKGNKWLRDENGRAVPKYNYQDPSYKNAVKITNRIHTMRMFEYAWFEYDTDCKMKTKRSDFPEDKVGFQKYYMELFEELKRFGFSTGDFATIVNAILKASATVDDEVEEATEDDFLSEG